MSDIEGLLNRWKTAGVLDAGAADRIRAFESVHKRPMGLRWQGTAALVLGAILLGCGVVLFVAAHWNDIGPGARFALVMAMVAVCHLAGAVARPQFRGLSTALHAVGTVAAGAAIALVGQIFNIEEHWPAAILLWALAALAGWILLRDEAQQTLTLLLFPAWMFSELAFYADGHIGQEPLLGRFLFVWAILYLTLFLGSRRAMSQGVLFGMATVASVAGVVLMLASWRAWSSTQTYLSFGTRVWAWSAIAVLPLGLSCLKARKSIIPVAAAIACAVALPWCQRTWTEYFQFGTAPRRTFVHMEPNLAAHTLVAAFAVFLIGWGVRQTSRALVNFGVVGFALAVAWFYFSNIFDKIGRSMGLIGLGILFLAGGWALEKTRRSLLARMAVPDGEAL